MKKLILLIAVIFYMFSCNTEDSKTTQGNIDSIAIINSMFSDTMTDEAFYNIFKSADFAELDKWRIDNAVAEAMIKWDTDCPVGDRRNSGVRNHRLGVYMRILARYPFRVTSVDARYRTDDEERYCKHRTDVNSNPQACKVGNHRTVIYKAISKNAATEETIYYDFRTICPPPYDDAGDCALPFDSSRSKTGISTDSIKK